MSSWRDELRRRLAPPGTRARGGAFVSLWQDIRYSVRSLRRTPGFSLTVVAALALTIGPTTAILSVGNWLLWRPIPGVAEPDRLAVVWFGEWRGPTSVSPRWMSEPNLADLGAVAPAMAGAAGWQESQVSFAVDGVPPRYIGSAHATVNFFGLLGVRPIAGRAFTADDDRLPLGSPVAVISARLAEGVFGGATGAVGRAMTLNGRRMTVIGVLPPGFVGATPYSDVDVWFPATTYYYLHHLSEDAMRSRRPRTHGSFYTFVVRLAPGATPEALQAQLDVAVPPLVERYPDDNEDLKGAGARVFAGLGAHELMRPSLRRLVGNLLLVGGVLALLGCANVVNLLLARGVGRARERAVRLALGASRARLAQLALTESCLLALGGAGLGVAAAFWIKEIIRVLLVPDLYAPDAAVRIPIDAAVLQWTIGVALACGLGIGLLVAWYSSVRESAVTRPGPALARGRAGPNRIRSSLAATQVALSVALVTNAVLLVGSLRQLAAVDLGFEPAGVSVQYIDLDSHGYAADRAMAYDRTLVSRLASEPGVQAVSLSSNHPFGSGHSMTLPDPQAPRGAAVEIAANFVTDRYFDVLELPTLRGRVFEAQEALGAPRSGSTSVVLDERLARRLFGDAEPVGQVIRQPASGRRPAEDLVVVGIVGSARFDSLRAEPEPSLYFPFAYGEGAVSTRPVVLVRSSLPARDVGRLVQEAATALDATLPVRDAEPLTASIASTLSSERILASVFSLLGAVGFLLAALGLHGLLAQTVGERTRELGIRLAIGAGRGHVFGLVLRQAAWIGAFGGLAGLGLAALGSRVVRSQLFGVGRFDPWVYAASTLALLVVVLLSALRPARAATRVDPVEALRAE